MKYKLLSVNTAGFNINIGDYIQALASSQFLPHIDGFISREELNTYSGEETKVIMNGWFMHKPENWPPSNSIVPLFVAFHINTYTKGKMLSKTGIDYLKSNGPIGCRDFYTRDLLLKYNIKAYFSGCMTLTLGKNYYAKEKEDKCYFVDPVISVKWNKLKLLKNLPYYILHKEDIDKLSSNIEIGLKGIRKYLRIVTFFREYSRYFSYDTIMNAEYITHESIEFSDKFPSDELLLNEAERLVKKYARAKLVVTSRIHCALPCLGLETPVIYIDGNNNFQSSCRLGGLKELFNVLKWEKGHLKSCFDVVGKFGIENTPQNKNSWVELRNNLVKTVKDFIENN